jgi:hypothetical protein
MVLQPPKQAYPRFTIKDTAPLPSGERCERQAYSKRRARYHAGEALQLLRTCEFSRRCLALLNVGELGSASVLLSSNYCFASLHFVWACGHRATDSPTLEDLPSPRRSCSCYYSMFERRASAVSQLLSCDFRSHMDNTKGSSSASVWVLLPYTTPQNADQLCCSERSACHTTTHGQGKRVPSWL